MDGLPPTSHQPAGHPRTAWNKWSRKGEMKKRCDVFFGTSLEKKAPKLGWGGLMTRKSTSCYYLDHRSLWYKIQSL